MQIFKWNMCLLFFFRSISPTLDKRSYSLMSSHPASGKWMICWFLYRQQSLSVFMKFSIRWPKLSNLGKGRCLGSTALKTYRIAGYFFGYKFLRFGHRMDWIKFCGLYFCGRRSKRNNFWWSNIGLMKGRFDSIKSRVVWHLYSYMYKDYKHQTPFNFRGFLLSMWIRL